MWRGESMHNWLKIFASMMFAHFYLYFSSFTPLHHPSALIYFHVAPYSLSFFFHIFILFFFSRAPHFTALHSELYSSSFIPHEHIFQQQQIVMVRWGGEDKHQHPKQKNKKKSGKVCMFICVGGFNGKINHFSSCIRQTFFSLQQCQSEHKVCVRNRLYCFDPGFAAIHCWIEWKFWIILTFLRLHWNRFTPE